MVWDPESEIRGSRIRKKPIPDPGVKKAPDPDPQHCFNEYKSIDTVMYNTFTLERGDITRNVNIFASIFR
jgi:hypothetical protein